MLKIFFCHLNALFPLTSWKTTVFEDEPPKVAASGGRNVRNRCVLRHQKMGRFYSGNIGDSTEKIQVEGCRSIVDVLFANFTLSAMNFLRSSLRTGQTISQKYGQKCFSGTCIGKFLFWWIVTPVVVKDS